MSSPKSKSKKPKKSRKPNNNAGGLYAAGSSSSTIYEQVDKLDFYLDGKSVEADKGSPPTNCYMVAVPVVDSVGDLRFHKLRRATVSFWNRCADDLYLEILQPFGAHTDSNKVVAWAPVRNGKKHQSRWTVKANKPGGTFRLDLTDNNFTLPATSLWGPDKDSKTVRLHLNLFAFAVQRNRASFTGTEDASGVSSRALQFRVVLDYWGPESKSDKAVVVKGDYKDMGTIVHYPVKSAKDIYASIGLCPVTHYVEYESYKLDDEHWGGWNVPFYCGSGAEMKFDEEQKVCFLRVQSDSSYKALRAFLNRSPWFHLDIEPLPGMVLRYDNRDFGQNEIDNELIGVAGFGNCLVPRDRLHLAPGMEPAIPNDRGVEELYVAFLVRDEATKKEYYAPLVVGYEGTVHNVLNSYFREQPVRGNKLLELRRWVPYFDKPTSSKQNYASLFEISKVERPVVSTSRVQTGLKVSSVGSFEVMAVLNIVTVILRVVLAAYATYNHITVTGIRVEEMPGHKAYVEEDGFQIV